MEGLCEICQASLNLKAPFGRANVHLVTEEPGRSVQESRDIEIPHRPVMCCVRNLLRFKDMQH